MSALSARLPPLPVSDRHCPGYPRRTGQKGRRALQTKTGTRGASGYLSTWPAHMTSRIVDEGMSCFTKEKTRMHGCDDGLSGPPMGKPPFLQLLEVQLRRVLENWSPEGPKAQERKLQAYRDVFDFFIEDFRTYKPLLTSIKNEYEITLECLRDQVRQLEPLRVQLAMMSEQSDQRIMALHKAERAEVTELKVECRNLEAVISTLREEEKALQAQVSCLKDDLHSQYLAFRREHDARKLLIDKVNCMSNEKDQEHHEEYEEEDLLKLKLSLKVCRADMSRAQVELNQLGADYADVVPRRDWDALERDHQETQDKLERLQKDFDEMKAEYVTLVEEHKEVVQQRDSLQGKMEGDQGSYTPRPDWERCAELLGGSERWMEISVDLSSQQLLDLVLTELGPGTTPLDKEGTAGDTPACLRYEGTQKSLGLEKADVVRVIKEVWKEKAMEDEQSEERSGLAEFLRRHLDRRHGEHAGDWAYSLLQACGQNHDDDLISLFYNILTGKVDESVHHGQTLLLSHLWKEFLQSDATESGVLSTEEFREALKRAVPQKEEQDVEELLKVAQTELLKVAQTELENSGGSISYQALFSEDADGTYGSFLSLVKKQATEERLQYISQLREGLGGKGEVEMEDLKMAFEKIDPALDQATLDRYMGLAFQTPAAQRSAAPLDTELALQRLLVADVSRAGPPPPLDRV